MNRRLHGLDMDCNDRVVTYPPSPMEGDNSHPLPTLPHQGGGVKEESGKFNRSLCNGGMR
ncbi:hypothetical protein ES703_25267 [subsurface metagenome]